MAVRAVIELRDVARSKALGVPAPGFEVDREAAAEDLRYPGGQRGGRFRLYRQAAPAGEHLDQAVHRRADYRHTESHGENRALRPSFETRRDDAGRRTSQPLRRVFLPACEHDVALDAEVGGESSELLLHRPAPNKVGGGAGRQQGERPQQEVRPLFRVKAPDVDKPPLGQPRMNADLGGVDYGAALAQAGRIGAERQRLLAPAGP